MKCQVCGGEFGAGVWSSPREFCDCGQNVSWRRVIWDEELDLPALKAAWAAKQAADDVDAAPV